jgi:hypothetical protein
MARPTAPANDFFNRVPKAIYTRLTIDIDTADALKAYYYTTSYTLLESTTTCRAATLFVTFFSIISTLGSCLGILFLIHYLYVYIVKLI